MKTLEIQSRHKIRFIDATELACVTLGALGRTTDSIAKELGLSRCQVTYRLKKAEISRKDIRNGKSEIGKYISSLTFSKVRTKLAHELQPKFL